MDLRRNKSWKLFKLICAAYFLIGVDAHGIMSQPRQRGALRTQRNLVPQVMDPKAPIDYCPHCQNCGGVGMVRAGGPWKMYSPFQYKRAGLTMCGDPVGKNEHTSKGLFANPPSMPFAATYEAGSIVNFEYDWATNHNGFVSFYLCDVSRTPDHDIKDDPPFWKENCHELERSPHSSCESGNDKECGPIDPKYPGRFVVPCRDPSKQDKVVGGPNGKMAYKIPDVEMSHAVIQSYWMTANTCNPSDGFMDSYKYPSAWAGCPGDGGSVGGHYPGRSCAETGGIPEEFLNCADVRIVKRGN